MNKMKIILGTFFLTFILLLAQFLVINRLTDKEGLTLILAAARDISTGEIITAEMIYETEIAGSGSKGDFVSDPDEIYGKIAGCEILKGDIISLKRLKESSEAEKPGLYGDNTRHFTIEFKADQANGWFLESGKNVDILFIPDKNAGETGSEKIIRIENVRVAYIINDKGGLYSKDESGSSPKYISFEVDNKLDEFLARAKGIGRLEISVIP